jgi:hypothetical protein
MLEALGKSEQGGVVEVGTLLRSVVKRRLNQATKLIERSALFIEHFARKHDLFRFNRRLESRHMALEHASIAQTRV